MDNINVAIRVRPLNKRELAAGQGGCWSVVANSMTQCTPQGKPIPSATYAFVTPPTHNALNTCTPPTSHLMLPGDGNFTN